MHAVRDGTEHERKCKGQSDDEVIEELFLASLSRRPTSEETEVAKRLMAVDRKRGTENVQWVLLNSPEFLLNH